MTQMATNPSQQLPTFSGIYGSTGVMPIQSKDDVGSRGSCWLKQWPKWQLIDDLCGGTVAMRQAGTRWLPNEKNEELQQYMARVGRTILFGALKNTIGKCSDEPFKNPVVVDGTHPDWVVECLKDMDRAGNDVTSFTKMFFESGAKYGQVHLLVDFPNSDPGTKADDKAKGRRPTFVKVDAPQVLGFKTEPDPLTHAPVLTEVRYKETRTEPDGKYGEVTVEYVRIYTTTTFEVFKKAQGDTEFKSQASGTHTFGRVPFFTYYIEKKGFMLADPPLEDLAWLNIAHWQSSSDQRNILRFARIGLLMITGLTQEEFDEGITIGPGAVVKSTNDQADGRYIEYTGKAIDAGQADLDKLEQQMETLGMAPFIGRSSAGTATGKVIDESRSEASIMTWVRDCENAILKGFEMAAEWMGLANLPDDFDVNIYSDFSISMTRDGDVDRLQKMRQGGDLSQKTFLQEVQRRGLINEKVDIDDEIEAIATEGPALGLIKTTIAETIDPATGKPVVKPPAPAPAPGPKPPAPEPKKGTPPKQ